MEKDKVIELSDEQIKGIKCFFQNVGDVIKNIKEFFKKLWENVKNTFIKIYIEKFKDHTELRKILSIRQRVNSKRLKKKYDNKIRTFIFSMI